MKMQARPPYGGVTARRSRSERTGRLPLFALLLLLAFWMAVLPALALSGAEAEEASGASTSAEAEGPSGETPEEAPLPLLQRSAAENGLLLPGELFSLELYAAGGPVYGFEGELLYEDGVLLFSSAESLLPGWNIYLSGNHFLLCADTMESPLDTPVNIPVCRFTFCISSDAVPGKDAGVRLRDFTVTDGATAILPGDPAFAGKVASADAGFAGLSSLSVGDYTLEPAFSPDVFAYTVRDLPHTLETLPITYEPKADGLTVTEDFPPLSDGKNIFTLTVSAEDGSAAIYTITAMRKFGDGYEPSDDAALSALVPSAGTLSPVFLPDVKSYILYLPAEYLGQPLQLSPTPRGEMAVSLAVTAVLHEGANPLTVSCTAEDGSESRYTVTAIVLPAHEDGAPAPYICSDTRLTGILTLEETDREYLLVRAVSRPDGSYEFYWTFNGVFCGNEAALPKSEALRDGMLRVQMIGVGAFSGSLSAEVYLDENGNIAEPPAQTEGKGALSPAAAAILGGVVTAAIAVGFLAGIPAGKRSAKAKSKKEKE